MSILTKAVMLQKAAFARRGSLKDLGDLLTAIIKGQPHNLLTDVTDSAITLTQEDHGHNTITLNRAAGVTVTLPAATGSGMKFKFFCGTTVTSNNNVIQVANSTDILSGMLLGAADGGNTVNGWETAATSDTASFNGSTTGGIKGDIVEVEDVASGVWAITGTISQTGTEATPFSAAV